MTCYCGGRCATCRSSKRTLKQMKACHHMCGPNSNKVVAARKALQKYHLKAICGYCGKRVQLNMRGSRLCEPCARLKSTFAISFKAAKMIGIKHGPIPIHLRELRRLIEDEREERLASRAWLNA